MGTIYSPINLVKAAYRQGLIKGKKVALDSSFVKTYSGREELGSGGYSGHKLAFVFKLHALVDAETGVMIALIIGDGLTHDSQVAISHSAFKEGQTMAQESWFRPG